MGKSVDILSNIYYSAFHYLNFVYHGYRKTDFINEGLLKFPLINIIDDIDVSVATFEMNHPVFDRKRVDLYFSKEKVDYFFEFKYISNNKPQVVLDDIFRLVSIKREIQKSERTTRCFLLAFGDNLVYERCMIEKRSLLEGTQDKKYSDDLLSFELINPIRKCSLLDNDQLKEGLEDFIKRYSEYELIKIDKYWDISIRTDLLNHTQGLGFGELKYSFPFIFSLWEVDFDFEG